MNVLQYKNLKLEWWGATLVEEERHQGKGNP
jgi:hypothetical protein